MVAKNYINASSEIGNHLLISKSLASFNLRDIRKLIISLELGF